MRFDTQNVTTLKHILDGASYLCPPPCTAGSSVLRLPHSIYVSQFLRACACVLVYNVNLLRQPRAARLFRYASRIRPAISNTSINHCPLLRPQHHTMLANVCSLFLSVSSTIFYFTCSASGTSAVAIDNKIEQAMVSRYHVHAFSHDHTVYGRRMAARRAYIQTHTFCWTSCRRV